MPDDVSSEMARISLEQSGFSHPPIAEQQERNHVVERSLQSPLHELVTADPTVTAELQKMNKAFDAAMESHFGAAAGVTMLPRWRFRYPPYHYGVTDNGLAQVKQAFTDGRLFVNSLSGHMASGLPGRVTGVATVGMEVTSESLDSTPSRPVSVKASLHWAAAWNIVVAGYSPPFVGKPWGELRVRLDLLVFGPNGFITSSGPQELVNVHFEDAPGSATREWSGAPSGAIDLRTPSFFLPADEKRWVNVDLYVEANSGETIVSRASASCMSNITLSHLRFWV